MILNINIMLHIPDDNYCSNIDLKKSSQNIILNSYFVKSQENNYNTIDIYI